MPHRPAPLALHDFDHHIASTDGPPTPRLVIANVNSWNYTESGFIRSHSPASKQQRYMPARVDERSISPSSSSSAHPNMKNDRQQSSSQARPQGSKPNRPTPLSRTADIHLSPHRPEPIDTGANNGIGVAIGSPTQQVPPQQQQQQQQTGSEHGVKLPHRKPSIKRPGILTRATTTTQAPSPPNPSKPKRWKSVGGIFGRKKAVQVDAMAAHQEAEELPRVSEVQPQRESRAPTRKSSQRKRSVSRLGRMSSAKSKRGVSSDRGASKRDSFVHRSRSRSSVISQNPRMSINPARSRQSTVGQPPRSSTYGSSNKRSSVLGPVASSRPARKRDSRPRLDVQIPGSELGRYSALFSGILQQEQQKRNSQQLLIKQQGYTARDSSINLGSVKPRKDVSGRGPSPQREKENRPSIVEEESPELSHGQQNDVHVAQSAQKSSELKVPGEGRPVTAWPQPAKTKRPSVSSTSTNSSARPPAKSPSYSLFPSTAKLSCSPAQASMSSNGSHSNSADRVPLVQRPDALRSASASVASTLRSEPKPEGCPQRNMPQRSRPPPMPLQTADAAQASVSALRSKFTIAPSNADKQHERRSSTISESPGSEVPDLALDTPSPDSPRSISSFDELRARVPSSYYTAPSEPAASSTQSFEKALPAPPVPMSWNHDAPYPARSSSFRRDAPPDHRQMSTNPYRNRALQRNPHSATSAQQLQHPQPTFLASRFSDSTITTVNSTSTVSNLSSSQRQSNLSHQHHPHESSGRASSHSARSHNGGATIGIARTISIRDASPGEKMPVPAIVRSNSGASSVTLHHRKRQQPQKQQQRVSRKLPGGQEVNSIWETAMATREVDEEDEEESVSEGPSRARTPQIVNREFEIDTAGSAREAVAAGILSPTAVAAARRSECGLLVRE
ncbi:MAG: hypothetical protein M1831_007239 [Alyxoria varia]|nr:MAG: hypothetical protein M1831_007239 [Alyxoria varia]